MSAKFMEDNSTKELIEQLESKSIDYTARNVSLLCKAAREELAVRGVTLDENWLVSVGSMMSLGGSKATIEAAEFAAKLALGAESVFSNALVIVQVLGMVADVVDPCGLNEQVSAASLQQLSAGMNEAFRNSVLSALESVAADSGDIYMEKGYPLKVDLMNNPQVVKLRNTPEMQTKRALYVAEYLNKLNRNNYGDAITRHPQGNLIQAETRRARLVREVSLFVSNGNTVIAASVRRWLPLLVVLVVFAVAFLFVLFK
uniref:Uncharacterized protein n=1 Tax=viral metagenome TaxID=1070528 RepID=A0A6C0KDV3_9ZZZZ